MWLWQLLVSVSVCSLHSAHVAVPGDRSFVFEGGSKFLYEDTLLDPEGGGRAPLRNVGNHLLANMTLHHGRI